MNEDIGTLSVTIRNTFPFIQVGFQKNPKCFFWSLWRSLGVPLGSLRLAPLPVKWERNKNFRREFLRL